MYSLREIYGGGFLCPTEACGHSGVIHIDPLTRVSLWVGAAYRGYDASRSERGATRLPQAFCGSPGFEMTVASRGAPYRRVTPRCCLAVVMGLPIAVALSVPAGSR